MPKPFEDAFEDQPEIVVHSTHLHVDDFVELLEELGVPAPVAADSVEALHPVGDGGVGEVGQPELLVEALGELGWVLRPSAKEDFPHGRDPSQVADIPLEELHEPCMPLCHFCVPFPGDDHFHVLKSIQDVFIVVLTHDCAVD